MSVTVVKNGFGGTDKRTVAQDLRLWIVSQFPDLKLIKSGEQNTNYPWWLYQFEGTNSGISFYGDFYHGYGFSLTLSFIPNVSTVTSISGGDYAISSTTISEHDGSHYYTKALVAKTQKGVIIQGISYDSDTPYEKFIYIGKATSALRGEISFYGYFSAAGRLYINAGDQNQSYLGGSLFWFKINSENDARWMHGVLSTILSNGSSGAIAGSIVASAVYGVTSAAWMEPIRIDDFYAVNGLALPPYYTDVTVGGRKMQRVGKELLLEG